MKLWQKNNRALDKKIEAFTVGRDTELDQQLVRFDCLASIAHAKMLNSVGILKKPELRKLQRELLSIIKLNSAGKFRISAEDEDVHSKVETTLTKKLGGLGKKVHTGRSRNDQVLVDLRLYSKQQLLETQQLLLQMCSALLRFSKKYEFVPMAGYTHLQRAMPCSIGLWAGSFVESLLDDLLGLKNAYTLNDQNPLGSAAGYGVSIKIDRLLTTKLLGFSRIQNNVLYAQNSRGKIESIILSALVQVMLDLNKLATDLVLFNSQEFNFVTLPPEFCTGSSLMPQKMNPDVLELIRGKSSIMLSYLTMTLDIVNSLPSGYNRDFQLTKAPLFDGFKLVKETLDIFSFIVPRVKVNRKALVKACSLELFATDKALELVKQGVPFRDAYRIIAESKFGSKADIFENIKGKRNIGATGNLGLHRLVKRVKKESLELKRQSSSFSAGLKRLEKM